MVRIKVLFNYQECFNKRTVLECRVDDGDVNWDNDQRELLLLAQVLESATAWQRSFESCTTLNTCCAFGRKQVAGKLPGARIRGPYANYM